MHYRIKYIVTVYGFKVQRFRPARWMAGGVQPPAHKGLRPGGGLRFFHIIAFNLSANCWLFNLLENDYYTYHYNYSTTQLLDDLTRFKLKPLLIISEMWYFYYLKKSKN